MEDAARSSPGTALRCALCPPQRSGQTPRLGPRDPSPGMALAAPSCLNCWDRGQNNSCPSRTQMFELLGQRTEEKKKKKPKRLPTSQGGVSTQRGLKARGGGRGYPVSVLGCPVRNSLRYLFLLLFQRLQTFDLKSSAVNFKTLLWCGNEKMNRAPGQPILRIVRLLELVKMAQGRAKKVKVQPDRVCIGRGHSQSPTATVCLLCFHSPVT